MLTTMRKCFFISPMGLEAVFDYLDFLTDISGFNIDYATPQGCLHHGLLKNIARYMEDNPGTKKTGSTVEQVLDSWIKARS
jgi:hypothetical protein